MQIDSGLDTGPMLLKYETEIAPDETAPELYARLAEAGAPLIVETLRALDRGTITPTPQDNSQATLAPPLKKEDGRINWSLPAQKIYNRIRGFQPWPGTFTTFRSKQCAIWGKPAPDHSSYPNDGSSRHGQLARKRPAQSSSTGRKWMSLAAERPLCAWNSHNSKAATKSPPANSQMARVWRRANDSNRDRPRQKNRLRSIPARRSRRRIRQRRAAHRTRRAHESRKTPAWQPNW